MNYPDQQNVKKYTYIILYIKILSVHASHGVLVKKQ